MNPFLRLLLIFAALQHCIASEQPIRIYIDADFTRAVDSAQSIHKGITTAFTEINNTLHKRKIEIVIKDHRGSSIRSKKNLDDFLQDENALAIFAGLHSPPLLSNLKFINEQGIIILDPWAAAGPITRFPSAKNSVFRLSIDDSKAGYTIVKHAAHKRSCKKNYLLLENTGWGKSNQRTMSKALKKHGLHVHGVEWFNWGIKSHHAKIKINNIIASGADSILLVSNTPEAIVFCQAIASLPAEERIPIFSHWGFLGGDFTTEINKEVRSRIDFSFIQTSFSFLEEGNSAFSKNVFKNAQNIFPELETYQSLKAPNGFVHAYDLSRLFISAVNNITFDGDIKNNREKLRAALENINTPVQGLIKTYNKPFSAFSSDNLDAHEALTIDDFTMAQFGDDNEILHLK